MRRGRLIAVEGTDPGVLAAAQRMAREIAGAGISRYDASGVFFDLGSAPATLPKPSSRILLTLYAADLAFRLRWEIEPALDEGRAVIAAPYVHTAIALGRAAGLPLGWLRELFRFAPRAAKTYRAAPGGEAKSGLLHLFRSRAADGDAASLAAEFDEYFDALERRRACRAITL